MKKSSGLGGIRPYFLRVDKILVTPGIFMSRKKTRSSTHVVNRNHPHTLFFFSPTRPHDGVGESDGGAVDGDRGIHSFELFCAFDGFPRLFFLVTRLIPPQALGLFFHERYEDVQGTHGKRISVAEFEREGKVDESHLKLCCRHPWRLESESKKFDWSPNIIFLVPPTSSDTPNPLFSSPALLQLRRPLQREELFLFYGTLWQKKLKKLPVSCSPTSEAAPTGACCKRSCRLLE